MANDDRHGGLIPINATGSDMKLRPYTITDTYGTALFIGDAIKKVAGGTVERSAAGEQSCGAAVAFEKTTASDRGPKHYFPASSTGTWKVLVADDPDQEFEITEDGDTSDVALADRGAGFDLIYTDSGDTTTGRSGMELDSSSTGHGATSQVVVIDKVDAVDNALGDWCRWIVKIANHQNGPFAVAAQV